MRKVGWSKLLISQSEQQTKKGLRFHSLQSTAPKTNYFPLDPTSKGLPAPKNVWVWGVIQCFNYSGL